MIPSQKTAPKAYNHAEVEDSWYQYWLDNKLFESDPDQREPYTIVIPPPNVTGVLHMGHMLNNTIQDILIRRARMRGYNACWVPGTDHASIATEAKVVGLLKEKGLDKWTIGREKFLEHAFAWKEKYGGIILGQLKKMGASCDWRRTAFTMDETRYKAVIDAFARLYNQGLIYRGTRMVNWDPRAMTALSDEEVVHKECVDKLYYVLYRQVGTQEYLTIATTRPETIMADTAVCVNPTDPRFVHLIGKKVEVPLIGREIPIIADEYVDKEFGTGCLKVTPAHDVNDHELGKKHGLPTIDLLNPDGTLNENAKICVGMDRHEARIEIAKILSDKGLLSKVENLTHNVGHSERTGAVIEPRLSMQWFCRMEDLAKPALDCVLNGQVQFHPSKMVNTYRHWMENIKDWCISRQLWWGHRIPVWYLPDGRYVVAHHEEDALIAARALQADVQAAHLTQDPDVLDTWFSSWLWPISVFDGVAHPKNKEITYYYPTQVLVTGPDIIFFWVARMVMAGYAYRGNKPFEHVYFTGLVRDELGRKMSKQLGNSPDLLKLIDQYGADSVRFGILIASPAGNDLLFGEKLCEQGGHFINKIWNAFKLMESWHGFEKIVDNAPAEIVEKNAAALTLFQARFQEVCAETEEAYERFKMSEALQLVYRLIWDDFCSNYLEWVKPRKDTVIDRHAYEATVSLFDQCLRLLHPFMPFVTETLYHMLAQRVPGESICTAAYPVAARDRSAQYGQDYAAISRLTSDVRNYKIQHNKGLRETLQVAVPQADHNRLSPYAALIQFAAGIGLWAAYIDKPSGKASFLSGTMELFDLDSTTFLDGTAIESELQELKRLEGFLVGIEKKLDNQSFIQSAPASVVEREQKKRKDTLEKIESIQAKLLRLDKK
ncbi:MAG: valine--tRNA ligase [Bacteroidetes bacterium]|jgi:valyl-tRNA synthetase|nr:valine--tRNA ligase [Bacteroidota bacterium]